MDEYGAVATDATTKIAASDANRGGFAGRLVIARELAQQLTEPANELDELSIAYADKTKQIGAAMDYFLSRAEKDPDERTSMTPFLGSVVYMSDAASQGSVGVTKLVHSIKDLPKLARVLAPLSKVMSRGLSRVLASNETITSWGHRVRSLPDWEDPPERETEGESIP